MKKNLVQKFRKFYFALPKEEQKALFFIMTALRGGDSNASSTLKIFTTARVRGALFGKSEREFIGRALCFASLKKARVYQDNFTPDDNLRDLWQQADYHFKQHIQSAISALRKHGFKKTISDLMKFI